MTQKTPPIGTIVRALSDFQKEVRTEILSLLAAVVNSRKETEKVETVEDWSTQAVFAMLRADPDVWKWVSDRWETHRKLGTRDTLAAALRNDVSRHAGQAAASLTPAMQILLAEVVMRASWMRIADSVDHELSAISYGRYEPWVRAATPSAPGMDPDPFSLPAEGSAPVKPLPTYCADDGCDNEACIYVDGVQYCHEHARSAGEP